MIEKLKDVFGLKPKEAYAASRIDDSYCKFNFTAVNMRFNKVKGFFAEAEKDIQFNIKDLENSYLRLKWPVKGIRTGIPERDKQLIEAPHFFYAEKYPEITFKSNKISLEGKKQLLVVGDLKIKETEKTIALYMGYSMNKEGYQLFVDYSLDRFEYGIGENGSFSIGRQIELEIDIAIKF